MHILTDKTIIMHFAQYSLKCLNENNHTCNTASIQIFSIGNRFTEVLEIKTPNWYKT